MLNPMIERVVLVRLKPEYRAEVRTVAAHTEEVLAEAIGVRAVRVAVAADTRTHETWDLVLQLQFDDLPAVERYRRDPRHRKYVDVYLRPLLAAIRAFNFER